MCHRGATSGHREPWVHAKALGFSFEDKEEPIKGFSHGCDVIKFRKMVLTTVKRMFLRESRPRTVV